MKKITDLEITGITWNDRSIQIAWRSANAEMEAESCLYQHSDGTWVVDPWSRSLGASFGEKLLGALMKEFISKAFTYDDTSSFANSEVARVEGVLKKEDMYRKGLRQAAAASSRPRKTKIGVWFAD